MDSTRTEPYESVRERVCVCVRERERENDRETERERERWKEVVVCFKAFLSIVYSGGVCACARGCVRVNVNVCALFIFADISFELNTK